MPAVMNDAGQYDEETQIGRRANARARLQLPVELMFPDRTCRCTLENVSRGGARVLMDTSPRVGSAAFLHCAGYEFFCTIIWVRGRQCGLAFEDDVTQDMVLAVRRYAETYAIRVQAEVEQATGDWFAGKGHY